MTNSEVAVREDGIALSPFLSQLIAATNAAALGLRATIVGYLALGVFLIVMAVTTTDESLLLGQSTNIPQLGLQVPVTVAFGLGPFLVFVASVYLLLKRAAFADLLRNTETRIDREFPNPEDALAVHRLLAVYDLTAGARSARGSKSSLRAQVWISSFIVDVFPIVVLLVIEISSIRYQDFTLTFSQLLVLSFYIFVRIFIILRSPGPRRAWKLPRALGLYGALGLAIVAWCLPPDASDQVLDSIRAKHRNIKSFSDLMEYCDEFTCVKLVMRDPLDTLVCSTVGWGCRYMSLYSRNLHNDVAEGVIARLRDQHYSDKPQVLAEISGIDLHDRNFRFADLELISLYNADLSGSDLTGAIVSYADLRGADLRDATFEDASLQHTDLSYTNIYRTNFTNADLSNATLNHAWALDEDDLTKPRRRVCFFNAILRDAQVDSDGDDPSIFTGIFNQADLRGIAIAQPVVSIVARRSPGLKVDMNGPVTPNWSAAAQAHTLAELAKAGKPQLDSGVCASD